MIGIFPKPLTEQVDNTSRIHPQRGILKENNRQGTGFLKYPSIKELIKTLTAWYCKIKK
jgi:hypothetical protein